MVWPPRAAAWNESGSGESPSGRAADFYSAVRRFERIVSSDSNIFSEKAGEPLRSRERATNDNAILSRGREVSSPRQAEAEFAEQHSPDPALRKTGIHVIGDMPWGAHLCVFFETKADLLNTAATYFAAGLASNEFCVWVVSDPITAENAKTLLAREIPDFDQHLAYRRIEILDGTEWYIKGDKFDLNKVNGGWSEKLNGALARGYEGMRVSGNAFWFESKYWKGFRDYEHELDRSLAGQKMIALCTYSLQTSRAVDMLDVARAHQCTITRRNGSWELLETPDLTQAKWEIEKLSGALDVMLEPFPGHELLTPRERATLAQIVRGASNKEAARALGIGPRTVEFHRENIMRKLSAKNATDLVHCMLCDSFKSRRRLEAEILLLRHRLNCGSLDPPIAALRNADSAADK
jgi:DNA-binding CsgD family transcriptional regulator